MPFYSEDTYHDVQCLDVVVPQNTASVDFVDITGASLTTKELGQPAIYMVHFSVLIFSSLNNTNAAFDFLVDDVSIIGMGRSIFLKAKDGDIGYTFFGCAPGLSSDSVLKVQWKTNQGTLTLSEFGILINGIPESRVII
jgi:hypothetical protein